MDFVVPKKDLQNLLDKCVWVVDAKSTMPALSGVLLDATGPKLRCATTDLYRSVEGTLDSAELNARGSVCVPAKDLHERVKVMPEGPIQVLVNDSQAVTLKALGSARRFTLHGIPGGEFPQVAKPAPGSWSARLPAADLDRVLNQVYVAVSNDETRPHVNSALFEWSSTSLRLVSTDGHKLVRCDLPVEVTVPPEAQMLLPRTSLDTLGKLLTAALALSKKDKDPLVVTLHAQGPSVFVDLAGVRFGIKRVDAQFPPYQQVIPGKSPRKARLERARLMSVVNAARTAVDERRGVSFQFTSQALRVSSSSPDNGEAYDEMATDYTGAEITVCFNPDYVIKMLETLVYDEVEFGFDGELDPAVIRPCVEGESPYVGVLMPMRGGSA
jgi:DNA polymerase III subunit beta